MVEYLCHRCGYVASQRINLKHHLNRKKMCRPILGDISIEDIKKHYNLEIKKLNPNEPKMNKFEPKMNPNEPKMTPINYNEYECIYCNKCYSTNSHMRRHEKTCKVKKDNEKKDNEIKELKEMVEKLLVNSDGNTITNNNTCLLYTSPSPRD